MSEGIPRELQHSPNLDLVHRLRAITAELDLLGGRFAARSGLHPTDLRALIALMDFGRSGVQATPGRLGEALGLASPAVTALVDRLERTGFIRRDRDVRDRRRVLLSVTDQAQHLGWSFFGPLMARVVDAADQFDPTELTVIRRFLDSVQNALDDDPRADLGGGA